MKVKAKIYCGKHEKPMLEAYNGCALCLYEAYYQQNDPSNLSVFLVNILHELVIIREGLTKKRVDEL